MTLELAHQERDRQREQDREWILRIRAGDAAAFEQAFRSYHAILCEFAYRYVRAREVAEELVHDVFARLWEGRRRLELRDSLKSYLYAAVRNQAISHIRHALVERRWREDEGHDDGADAEPHALNDAQARLEAAELAVAVERVLARLPERCRLALTLRWQRQMSYAEVAEAMGIAVKTVETYVGRGLAALRDNYRALLPYL